MPDTDRHVEVKFQSEGVSVTLYENAEVVDEYWRTWDEVEDIRGEKHVAILG
jgi:hypothetical protein